MSGQNNAKQKATLRGIEDAFGSRSPVFIRCFDALSRSFRAPAEGGEGRAAFERWKVFLSIAYHSFPADAQQRERSFLIHTYLSVFAKLLAYKAVTDDDPVEETKIREIIDGAIFRRHHIGNFVEHDLFRWVLNDRSFPILAEAFRLIARELSVFDFGEVEEDVLKGIYQEMIDLDARHALGEHYTPDWLCERVVNEFEFKPSDRILDPSCGSGSFLRAVIQRLRTLNPQVEIENITRQVHGIDIHPLSVQIAKATILIALGRDAVKAKRELHLNVTLANALLAQHGLRQPDETDIPPTPHLLAGKFDYVIGNPPWFTCSSIRNEDYQDVLDKLARERGVKPERKANFPHLEIAAIFLAHCSGYFLRAGGRIAFVLPRSFFSADHHDNTRSGKAKGFALTAIWDLKDVSPLFRVPACVLFAAKTEDRSQPPLSGIEGKTLSGRLPARNCNLASAAPKLTEVNGKWYYVRQGESSAFSQRRQANTSKPNPYKKEFRQGATIVPRSLYFVDLYQPAQSDFGERIISVKTSAAVLPEAKRSWAGIDMKGSIESRFLFHTALSKSIVPFALLQLSLVVLPLIIERNDAGQKRLSLHSADDLRQQGHSHAARWFAEAEAVWEANKTEKSKSMTNLARLDFQRGLSGQNMDAPYLVLYTSSAQDANATMVSRADLNFEFIVESVTYVFPTHNSDEAYYLTSIFNSPAPNERMKAFQARGLFGVRHVHKKILDIYFPRFDRADKTHAALARLGESAHLKAAKYLTQQRSEGEAVAPRLGRLRADIKRHLAGELREIDALVKQISV